MSDGRPRQRQTEKDKEDASREFFHKITLDLMLAGFYTACSHSEKEINESLVPRHGFHPGTNH